MKKLNNKLYADAWQLIDNAHNITLLTHQNPDADGMSACFSLSLIFERMGKKTETIYPNLPEKKIGLQSDSVLIAKHTMQPDLIIACDTANYQRLYWPESFKTLPLINIDHHISNSIQGTINIVNPVASSTCEDLVGFISAKNRMLITKDIAELILQGMLYDSKAFHTNATSPTTLRIAADLIETFTIDWIKIKNEIVSNPFPIVIFWGNLLGTLSLSDKKNAVWVCVTQTDLQRNNLTAAALEGFNNFLSEISDVDMTLVFHEAEDKKTKVSLRSKQTDVNFIAQKFGGGGHKNAAGITTDIPLDAMIKNILALL